MTDTFKEMLLWACALVVVTALICGTVVYDDWLEERRSERRYCDIYGAYDKERCR